MAHVVQLPPTPSAQVMEIAHWHYTTFLDFLDHWQTLIAGVVALIAAIVTVLVTLRIERRKNEREVDGMRKSLALELRQLIPAALSAHLSLSRLSRRNNGPITAREVEHLSHVPVPIVYRENAGRIAMFGQDAMSVVIVYQLLDIARDGVTATRYSRDPDNINPGLIASISDAFLASCSSAADILPLLRTGVPAHDDKDAILVQKIREAADAVAAARAAGPVASGARAAQNV